MTTLPVPVGTPATPATEEVVYEVECILDPEAVAEFDAWVPGHVREVMRSPGFLAAETFRPAESGADGKVRRVNRYRVKDRAALDNYLENLAPALREDGARRFAGRARYERRVLAPAGRYGAGEGPVACANCGIALIGPYCSECGQHAHESARSIGALFHDAWHTLTHVDGRFWQTLRSLLLQPGFLTNEYFAERRARYVPPFRLYLILSIAFFGLASLASAIGGTEPVQFDPKPKAASPAAPSTESEAKTQFRSEFGKAVAEIRRDMAAEKAAEAAQAGQPAPAAGPAAAPAAAPGTGTAPATAGAEDDDSLGLEFGDPEDCARLNSSVEWLERAMQTACVRQVRDGGKTLGHAFVANIPKMMFVFLPLMAAVMLLLYWFPRRYYVEHLVFYLHVHAGLFLALVLVILVNIVGNFWSPAETIGGIAMFLTFFYAAWYVYRAMRVHYRNGRLLTLMKFFVIFIFYSMFLMLTLLATGLVSALTA